MTTATNFETIYQSLLFLENNLCPDIIHKIFIIEPEHFVQKWIDSDYNIMTFLGKLDIFNRQLVFNWANTSMLIKQ